MIGIYVNDVAHFIRPCPLISFNWTSSNSADGKGGGSYNITLTGTIIDNEGSPFSAYKSFATAYEPIPASQVVPYERSLGSILNKQASLRNLFANPCLRVEVQSIDQDDDPTITFYPRLLSINFEPGIWVNTCNYTIELEAGYLLDKDQKIIGAASYGASDTDDLSAVITKNGGFIKDYSESWSIEAEDGNGNTFGPTSSNPHTIRSYRVTRTINATGSPGPKTAGSCDNLASHPALQAKSYVLKRVSREDHGFYPGASGVGNHIASGTIHLAKNIYGGYNHLRTENIDLGAGSYVLTDVWLLSSGSAYENYNLSLNKSISDPLSSVTVTGTIKGLTLQSPSGELFVAGGPTLTFGHDAAGSNAPHAAVGNNSPYENAVLKYFQITNNGMFGPVCDVFLRARNLTNLNLNHVPVSVGLGTNEFTGEITYNIEYDDRPAYLISGVLSENISINDTYPGDVFAVIPVIGRPNGPVLQYLSGRTEYQRSLTIDLVMDRRYYQNFANAIAPTLQRVRTFSALSKPSLVEPFRSQINDVISAHSPAREIGVRKYFLSPPSESWDAKTGSYSLTMNWTYELNR